MIKLDRDSVWRADEKIGYLEGRTFYNEDGGEVGYYENDNIYRADGTRIGYIEKNHVYRDNAEGVGTVDDILEEVAGEGDYNGLCCAAAVLLFGKD